MLTINPSALRGTQNDAPLAQTSPSAAQAPDPSASGFASLLRQSRATPPAAASERAPAAAPAVPRTKQQASGPPSRSSNDAAAAQAPAASQASPSTPSASVPNDAANLAAQAVQAATAPIGAPPPPQAGAPAGVNDPDDLASGTDKPGPKTAAGDGQAASPAGTTTPDNIAAATVPTATTLDPSVMQWLAGLQRTGSASPEAVGTKGTAAAAALGGRQALPVAGRAATGRATSAAGLSQAGASVREADRTEASLVGSATATAGPLGEGDLSSAPSDLPSGTSQPGAPGAGAQDMPGAQPADARRLASVELASLGTLAQALTAPSAADKSAGAQSFSATLDAASSGAAVAAFAPSVASAARNATTTSVALATAVNAPDFSQALGAQMTVLARDGVQHAELHLNPAEMGPVSVQISMDGTQARVDFAADVAATRHAIEAGLPELASALRDAGFTLAGGGVSQHPRGRGDGGDAGSPGKSAGGFGASDAEDAQGSVATVARRTLSVGGLDLYA